MAMMRHGFPAPTTAVLSRRSLALALAALPIAGRALAQAPPLPPGYLPRTAPPPTGSAPGMKVQEFAPGAGRTYKVTLRPGDEILSGLYRFAAARPMTQAQMTGIGGVLSARLAWFDPKVLAFKPITVDEKCEISGFTGTIITDAQGKLTVHAHVVLTRTDGSTVSGHLISAVVNPILEVFVTDLGLGRDVAIP